jgi:O-antigen/teichoic acid export membrane protein
LQASLVRLEESHGASLVLAFLVPLGGLAGGIIGFMIDASVGAFFAASALGLTLTSLSLGLSRLGFYGLTGGRGDVNSILSNIAPFVFISVLSWVGGYGNTYLVKSLFATSDVAKFTFAFTLSGVMQLVATSLNQVWAPRFYRLVNELPMADVERRNRRFFIFQGLSLGAVAAALMIALPFTLELFGGNLLIYRGLTAELLLLCSAYAVSIPWWHSQNFFYANGRGRELMKVTIVGSIAGVFAWVASAWMLGVIGIYVGFMLQMLVRTVAAVISARRLWLVRVQWEGVALALLLMSAGAGLVPLLYSKP